LEESRTEAAEALNVAEREHAAMQAQLATLRQIQATAEENAPLREWIDRHALGSASRLWQKLRIEQGWETAVEAVLRERLHAIELADPGATQALLDDVPPTKASLFQPGTARDTSAPEGMEPLRAKIQMADPAVAGALCDWLAGVFVCEGTPSHE